ncbi:MAG TPA: hypothetical protein VL576_01160 [Candidatus Paceibacterota bacterium]|jgi:hypothetical protein|nr:hypothetical protein [Candidatus Paceibacterota bacterium]
MTAATRKIILSGLLGIVSAGVITATGYAATPAWVQNMSRPLLHQAVGKAIENDDYNAFAQAIQGKPGSQEITQAQFNALVSAYTLHKAGNDSEAQAQLQYAGIMP